MACSISIHVRSTSMAVHHLRDSFLAHKPCPTSLIFPRQPLSLRRSFVVYVRRRRPTAVTSRRPSSKKSKKKRRPLAQNEVKQDDVLDDYDSEDEDSEEDGSDDDAVEALFRKLEEDLKNDDGKDDKEFTEEDAAKLERELADALGEDGPGYIIEDDDDEENVVQEDGSEDLDSDEEDEDDEDEEPAVIRNWQLRRLAEALKVGRRKLAIKNLAGELCLDRAIVLQLLREPPPKLLMMSLALPDEPAPAPLAPEVNPTVAETDYQQNLHEAKSAERKKTENEKNMPMHLLQQKWYARKRLKKAQVDTLEKVYRRSKRPTDAMVSSIVHVTNLPRKKIIKWFEDKRAEDAGRHQRLPYQQSIS